MKMNKPHALAFIKTLSSISATLPHSARSNNGSVISVSIQTLFSFGREKEQMDHVLFCLPKREVEWVPTRRIDLLSTVTMKT